MPRGNIRGYASIPSSVPQDILRPPYPEHFPVTTGEAYEQTPSSDITEHNLPINNPVVLQLEYVLDPDHPPAEVAAAPTRPPPPAPRLLEHVSISPPAGTAVPFEAHPAPLPPPPATKTPKQEFPPTEFTAPPPPTVIEYCELVVTAAQEYAISLPEPPPPVKRESLSEQQYVPAVVKPTEGRPPPPPPPPTTTRLI
jgi:hypothetical protein